MLPCKEDEQWKDKHGTVYTIESFHCDRWAGWSVLFRAENEEEDGDDLKAVNFAYFACNFTRAEAKEGKDEQS